MFSLGVLSCCALFIAVHVYDRLCERIAWGCNPAIHDEPQDDYPTSGGCNPDIHSESGC